MAFLYRSIPSLPRISVTPTLILIILAPSMFLLLAGTSSVVTSSPVVPKESKAGHSVLDPNGNSIGKSFGASPPTAHGRAGTRSRILQNSHPVLHPRTRTLGIQSSNSHKEDVDGKLKVPATTTQRVFPGVGIGLQEEKMSICYTLCKDGMGGVACDCDLVPVG